MLREAVCAKCGEELTDGELEQYHRLPAANPLGRYYCSEHLQPAIDGEYLVKVIVPNTDE